jgi:glycosyltransferase involved in cell wall biosynthesis/LPS sulfotransferase NodH
VLLEILRWTELTFPIRNRLALGARTSATITKKEGSNFKKYPNLTPGQMTGIADLYLAIRRPNSKEARARAFAVFQKQKYENTRFVVLSWKRSGSNLLCGILHHHPEITMHNELFNPIDIFTYYPKVLIRTTDGDRWSVLGRDLYPEAFLEHIWSGKYADQEGKNINANAKAVGFKSFPDHWTDIHNDHICERAILDDFRIKKVVLFREDELAVFLSMCRSEITGTYMTHSYPDNLKVVIDPEKFQRFVNNYRDTFRNKYRTPMEKRDTFRISYEQLVDEETFERDILPLLWRFVGVDESQKLIKLKETVKQAKPDEDLSVVISNYEELEFAFRHTDVLHFERKRGQGIALHATKGYVSPPDLPDKEESDTTENDRRGSVDDSYIKSWSLLLPICSRPNTKEARGNENVACERFNSNRLIELVTSSQYNIDDEIDEDSCWRLLEETFATSLIATVRKQQLQHTECVVGIDEDDTVFRKVGARRRIRQMLPCHVVFVDISKAFYGSVCKIWNHLARRASNDFIVLLGDDIKLLDLDWQPRVVKRFEEIAHATGLPFGAACVAMHDTTFPGFPTFPVIHRWHMKNFGLLLPRQFVNQGGDPYLFELYARFNASSFEKSCQLENTIGGDAAARYKKHDINWRGQVLTLHLRHLESHLGGSKPKGICLDVVVPSYRTNNSDLLERIVTLRASTKAYVRFWLVVDNPLSRHVSDVQDLANRVNQRNVDKHGNYHVNVVHHGENRGASYARNIGYNYSTADWVLFIDDDVTPEQHILDAYLGAIMRYPDAKVFVGNTELPPSQNLWTEMLRTCNIMFFYGVSKHMVHPPWGVTANLMVKGARHNPTIQFHLDFPKTGGKLLFISIQRGPLNHHLKQIVLFSMCAKRGRGHRFCISI